MRDRPVGRVEDFTLPFLASFYLVVLMGLIAVWVLSDFLIALSVAFAFHIYLARKIHSRRLRSLQTE